MFLTVRYVSLARCVSLSTLIIFLLQNPYYGWRVILYWPDIFWRNRHIRSRDGHLGRRELGDVFQGEWLRIEGSAGLLWQWFCDHMCVWPLVCADLAVWWLAGDYNMFPRGSCVPEGHPIPLPWGHGSSHQQEQQAIGWGVDGRLQRLLLHHITRYATTLPF